MLIKLTDIDTNEKIGNNDAVKITGKRLDGEGEWSRKIFSDNKELRKQLGEFGIGDDIEVSLTQKGKFWNVTSITRPSAELIEKVKNGGSNYGPKNYSSEGGGAKSGGTSKEEWAAKDIKTQASIARSVALKAAIEFRGDAPKMTEEKLIDFAKKFMPFLMGDDLSSADALEPPV